MNVASSNLVCCLRLQSFMDEHQVLTLGNYVRFVVGVLQERSSEARAAGFYPDVREFDSHRSHTLTKLIW